MEKIIRVSLSKFSKMLEEHYNVYVATTIYDVYKNCSELKKDAYLYCREKYYRTVSGRDFTIKSANTYQFTCEWIGLHINNDGRYDLAIFRQTKENSYIYMIKR